MAEQGSKAFGEYQGSRINPIPDGFLTAYAQVAKNYSDLGRDLGKGVGDLIARYQAERATEDLLNQKTNSPEFVSKLDGVMTFAASEKSAIMERIKRSGVDLNLEDAADLTDLSTIQHPSNQEALNKAGVRESVALLNAYSNLEKMGGDFLKSPDKFNNKKKMELIGAVTTAYDTAQARAKSAKEAEDEAFKRRVQTADLVLKERAALPETKPVDVVRDAIGKSTSMSRVQAEAAVVTLKKRLEKEREEDIAAGGTGLPRKETLDEIRAVSSYLDTDTATEDNTLAAPENPFISVARAKEQLREVQKTLEDPNVLADEKERTRLQGIQYELEEGINNASQDKSDRVYVPEAMGMLPDAKIVENNRKFQMAVTMIENANGIETRNGKLMMPSLSVEDRKRLYRMIELGGYGVRDYEDGLKYDVDKDGMLTATPLTKEEMEERTGSLLEGKPLTPTQVLAARKEREAQAKAAGNASARTFGSSQVVRRNVPAIQQGGKDETISAVESSYGEPILRVAGRPELSVFVSGTANISGEDLQKFRLKMEEENQTLDSLEDARNILYEVKESKDPTTGKVRRVTVLKENLSEVDQVRYLQALYKMKRSMGKGLGPLSAGDYKLLDSNIMAQVPETQINWEDRAGVLRQFAQKYWTEAVRDPKTLLSQLDNIQKDIVNRTISTFQRGTTIWAVDENEQRVDSGFTITRGLFMNPNGDINRDHVYIAQVNGKSELRRLDVQSTLQLMNTGTDTSRALSEFKPAMEAEYAKNKNIREPYMVLIDALADQRRMKEANNSDWKGPAMQDRVRYAKGLLADALERYGMHPQLISAYVNALTQF